LEEQFAAVTAVPLLTNDAVVILVDVLAVLVALVEDFWKENYLRKIFLKYGFFGDYANLDLVLYSGGENNIFRSVFIQKASK
jgi:hypothetical protein